MQAVVEASSWWYVRYIHSASIHVSVCMHVLRRVNEAAGWIVVMEKTMCQNAAFLSEPAASPKL